MESPTPCPYCSAGPNGAGSYGIVPSSGGFTLSVGSSDIATASRQEEVIQIRRPSAFSSEIFILSSDLTDRYMSVLLDRSLHPIAQITYSAQLRRAADRTCDIILPANGALLQLRTDGPTGLHLVKSDGGVVALASLRADSPGAGLDIAMVSPQPDMLPLGYFGLFIVALVAHAHHSDDPLPWGNDLPEVHGYELDA